MSIAAKYKKKAAELEAQKQFDGALELYTRAIAAGDAEGAEVDVALLNKVGDLTLRSGRVSDAVAAYERAVEHYTSVGLFNNAIALCHKILRHAPGRTPIYLTLGRACARKGMRGDASRNLLEYASRMREEGRTDEAMRALREVAWLMPELAEVRGLVEEHAERAGIALPTGATAEPLHADVTRRQDRLVFLDVEYDPPTGVVPDLELLPGLTPAAAAPVVIPAETRRTSSLDDLLIFDPSAEEEVVHVEPLGPPNPIAIPRLPAHDFVLPGELPPIRLPERWFTGPVPMAQPVSPPIREGSGLPAGVEGIDAPIPRRTPTAPFNRALDRWARLRDEVAANPGDWARRRRLAEALLEAGERMAGLDELAACAHGLQGDGALHEAAHVLDALVRVAPERIGYHQQRVELAVRLGDRDRLRTSYLDLADELVRSGHAVRAEPVYVRVLEIDPWDDRARAALGEAAPPPPSVQPSVTPAEDGYVNLADWLADDTAPRDTRMRMAEPTLTGDEAADFNRVLQCFREGVARSLGEDDYASHYDLGVAYKEMGLLDDAVAEFQRALRSPTHRLPSYEALGQCFLEQGSFPVAVTVLSRALHEPGLDDEQRVGVLYLLGYACEALQRRDEARGYYQRVYATDMHFRDVASRLTGLQGSVR